MSSARLLAVFGLFVISGCGGSGGDPPGDKNPGAPATVTVAPEFTGDGWQVSTPAAEQMDEAQVLSVLQAVRDTTLQGIDSLVIARNGRLVGEGYFNGFNRDAQHDLRSAGKSFTSALTGIAAEQGLLAPDDLLSARIPNFAGHDHMDARKQAITLRNLLNMQSSLDCDDWVPSSPGQEERVYNSRDWIAFMLDLPMLAEPGAQSHYCSGGVILLGHVVSLTSGMDLDAYANQWLFGPLEIRQATWRRSPDGKATGGGGLRLRPRDAAKLGALYAAEGLWYGQRVVPEEWVRRSQQTVTTLGGDAYGYLWWKRTFMRGAVSEECYFAWGNGGNFVFVFPALELVITFTGSNYNSDKSNYPLRFVGPILSAVR